MTARVILKYQVGQTYGMGENTTNIASNESGGIYHDLTSGVLMEDTRDWYHDTVDELASKSIFGIPDDILLVLLIDAVLISLRVSNILNPSQFIGAKVVGTTFLIAGHFL